MASTESLKHLRLKLVNTIELVSSVRGDARAQVGYELEIRSARVLNPAAGDLPFNSAADSSAVGAETRLEHLPLAVRSSAVGDVFRIQAALLGYFRDYLRGQLTIGDRRRGRGRRWAEQLL